MEEDVDEASLNFQAKLVGVAFAALVVVSIYNFQRFLGTLYDVPWAHVVSYLPYVFSAYLVRPVSARYLKWRKS